VQTTDFIANLAPWGEHPNVIRDLDLIRQILLRVESDAEMDGSREFIFEDPEVLGFMGRSPEELQYHVKLLIDYDYVKGNPQLPSISRLTMAGHEFLGSIAAVGTWEKVKDQFGSLPYCSLQSIQEFGRTEVRKQLGLA
jgi:hypothetical protein